MCHLILALPIIALPMLWLLPAQIGIPAYAALVVLAVAAYWLAARAMRLPITTGVEALRGAIGTVRRIEARSARVWVTSELWSAQALGEVLHVGDKVRVVDVDGLVLRVRKIAAPAASPGAAQTAGRAIDPGRSSIEVEEKS